ncbi:MAG TPA: nucleotidyltransferase family protein [Pyrinomonadaceae bacterium]|nr:nucleotidyltransferase family protein [Pyrinomonadaceae bacterium]
MQLVREEEVLLSIARRRCAADLLQQSLNWDYLFTTASAHGLLPLLQKELSTLTDLIPPHALSHLKRQSVSNTQAVLHLISKQIRVLKLFKEHEIRVATFKGAVLSQIAYGEIALRQAGDIDLLIQRRDFERAKALLESLGYQMFPKLTPAQLTSHLHHHCEITFMRDDWFTVIDLHWELAPKTFVLNLETDEVMSRLQSISLAGMEIDTFSVEDSVLYQSMHGAKHLWRRLEWVVALGGSIQSEMDWSALVQRAERTRMTRMLALGLRAVGEFCGGQIPQHVLERIDADKAMERLAAQIRVNLFAVYGPAGSRETNLYNLRIMDRKRDALISALRAIFVPTFTDWQAVKLPAPLHPLYYAVRPLRLSKVYGSSLLRRVTGDA